MAIVNGKRRFGLQVAGCKLVRVLGGGFKMNSVKKNMTTGFRILEIFYSFALLQ